MRGSKLRDILIVKEHENKLLRSIFKFFDYYGVNGMLLIKSGIMYNTQKACDLLIDGEVIMKIGEKLSCRDCDEVIDASGLIVAPGFIDAHAHFREPGFEYKEDIASGVEAAKKGGYTTVICMANTKPCIDNAEALRYVIDTGNKTGINVLSVAAVTLGLKGKALADLRSLATAGAVGFSDDGIPIMDARLLKNAMVLTKELDLPISLHEENPEMIGVSGVNAGKAAKSLGLTGEISADGAPRESESTMVARDCELALETGARVHIQHLSCAESVETVRLAKRRGANVTAEVTPQHFSLTEDAVLEKGTLAKLNPPFRTESDRQSLIAGLKDGTIDIIATDHAPHSAEEKSRPFAQAPSGIIGLETALPLGITKLVRQGYLSLPELIEKMALAPARLYGLESGIDVGKKADICIFAPDESFIVGEKFASKSSNSPFIGEMLYGRIKYTICGGKAVYRERDYDV